jgi:hypothetical protein
VYTEVDYEHIPQKSQVQNLVMTKLARQYELSKKREKPAESNILDKKEFYTMTSKESQMFLNTEQESPERVEKKLAKKGMNTAMDSYSSHDKWTLTHNEPTLPFQMTDLKRTYVDKSSSNKMVQTQEHTSREQNTTNILQTENKQIQTELPKPKPETEIKRKPIIVGELITQRSPVLSQDFDYRESKDYENFNSANKMTGAKKGSKSSLKAGTSGNGEGKMIQKFGSVTQPPKESKTGQFSSQLKAQGSQPGNSFFDKKSELGSAGGKVLVESKREGTGRVRRIRASRVRASLGIQTPRTSEASRNREKRKQHLPRTQTDC